MRILILDGMNTVYRAFHSYSRLQNNGNPVSIIYGMPSIVNGLINQFKPDKLYICWDGNRSSERIKLNPGYKKGRKKKTEEEKKAFYHQRDEVMKLFHALGVKQVYNIKLEADDLIYMLTRKLQKNKNNKITIVSTDKDFHQLIRSNVKVYNTSTRTLIHKKNVKNLYGYEAKHCVDYLCLTGDDSDNITGVRGVGPAKAAGILQEFSSIEKFLKSDKPFANINKELVKAVYPINKKLIDLKHYYKLFIKGKDKIKFYNGVKNPKLNKKQVIDICNKYNIKAFKENKFLKNYE